MKPAPPWRESLRHQLRRAWDLVLVALVCLVTGLGFFACFSAGLLVEIWEEGGFEAPPSAPPPDPADRG